jgi:drug/metabolite transporter (DMT)-like permease
MLLPIFIANIVLNTAPFWTSFLAWCFLGEPVKLMEIICMSGCFVGVIVIATSEMPHPAKHTLTANVTHVAGNMSTHGLSSAHAFNMTEHLKKMGFNKYMTSESAYIMGMVTMFVAAWSQAAVGVCTRKLKQLHFTIIMFTYAWIASLILLVFLTIEYFVTQFGETPRIFTYSKENYILMVSCALFNAFGMNCLTISRQSYKLAFVMIISYATLVYAWFADIFVFRIGMSVQQWIGSIIVFAFVIYAACVKLWTTDKPATPREAKKEEAN